MDATAFLGLLASIGGMAFYLSSSASSILSASLGAIFQGLGIILVYTGLALVLWSALGSVDIFLERFVRRG